MEHTRRTSSSANFVCPVTFAGPSTLVGTADDAGLLPLPAGRAGVRAPSFPPSPAPPPMGEREIVGSSPLSSKSKP